jgi:hypothetical protein
MRSSSSDTEDLGAKALIVARNRGRRARCVRSAGQRRNGTARPSLGFTLAEPGFRERQLPPLESPRLRRWHRLTDGQELGGFAGVAVVAGGAGEGGEGPDRGARLGGSLADVSELIPFILRITRYFCGVMYMVTTLPAAVPVWGIKLLSLNPPAVYISLVRVALAAAANPAIGPQGGAEMRFELQFSAGRESVARVTALFMTRRARGR